MGIFRKLTAEEIAEKERIQLEKEKLKAEKLKAEEDRKKRKAFLASPAGRARTAKSEGMKIFQIDISMSRTKGEANFGSSSTDVDKIMDNSKIIQSIEEEGWRLEHANYVYRMTESMSTDKVFQSGKREAINGDVVGIYIFRVL
jgi:hypothetical protein